MRGQAGLFGEIQEDEIVKIARKAAEERQQAAEKMSKHMRLDGTVPVCRGYAIYEDYEEYMKQRMPQGGRRLATWDTGKIRIEIRETLLAAGWTSSPGHPATRFYPPSTESPNLGRRLRRSDTLTAPDF